MTLDLFSYIQELFWCNLHSRRFVLITIRCGRNTWRFGKTVVSCWRGEFVLERSTSEAQSISFVMERWSVGHRAFAVETYLKNNDSLLTQDISSALQYSSERVSLVAILIPLGIFQEQGVWKETKEYGGFETEHRGRSGSNFSQHAAMSEAELPETLGGMCWQGHHLTDTVFRKWML
jgi:hypothetical protein